MKADDDRTERGMVPRSEWEQSEVHRASRYACGKCGREFPTPHDIYAHLDAEHPRKPKGKGGPKHG